MIGQYMPVGTPALALVETGRTWIEANFKETDLTHMTSARPRPSNWTPIRAASFTPPSRASAPAPVRSSRCCRRRTRPATGSRSSSAFPSVWRSRRRRPTCRSARASAPISKSIPATRAACPPRSARRSPGPASVPPPPATFSTSKPLIMATGPASPASPVKHAGMITVSIMLATIMQVLDTTIANVALPSMQGSLGAAQDTITWVLTSYIVAAAIATPRHGLDGGADWPQAPVPYFRRRLHRRLPAVRVGRQPDGDGDLPPVPGLVRCGAGAAVAGRPARHQPQGAARSGHGDVGRRHHGRPHRRPDFGRLADGFVRLALGVLHQPAGRHPGLPRHPRLPAGNRQEDTPVRLLRLRHAGPRHRGFPDDAGPGRATGLVLIREILLETALASRRVLGLRRPHDDRQGGDRQTPSSTRRSSPTATSSPACSSSSSSASSCWRPWRCCRRCSRTCWVIRR